MREITVVCMNYLITHSRKRNKRKRQEQYFPTQVGTQAEKLAYLTNKYI